MYKLERKDMNILNKIHNKNKKSNYKIKSILLVVSALILNFLGVVNNAYAANINTANIYAVNDCGSLLKYKGGN